MQPKRQLAAIMFTDIVGYTSLMGEDEEHAYGLLRKNRELQRPVIEKHHGEWLKEIGDGVLARFQTVSDAVYCALEIQKRCKQESSFQLRIGIHVGEVIVEDGDVFGDGVNIAARIESLAPDGGILVSESVHKNVINKKGINTKFFGEQKLRGVKEKVKVYQLKGFDSTSTGRIYQSPSSRRYILLAIFLALVIGLGYVLYNAIANKAILSAEVQESINKSIAVLPFVSLSSDPEKQYLADGVMDAILLHLSKIENLRVITRTSVERYRNTKMSIPEIADELNVEHVLEGSFQKYGDHVRLILQLSNGDKQEDHIWADEFDRDWSDIFTVQSEVAQTIAKELKAVITADEKQLIEKLPTSSLTAYDFYQRGNYEFSEGNLEVAEELFQKALEYDSTFAKAYLGLANIYFSQNYWDNFLSPNLMDSVLSLANIALTYDNELAEAYVIRGRYYRYNYQKAKALHAFDQAIHYEPNLSAAYLQKGFLYSMDDQLNAIINFQKASLLDRGPNLSRILWSVGRAYGIAGFKDISMRYVNEALMLDNDSASYYSHLAEIEDGFGNPRKSIEYGLKSYAINPNNPWITFLLGYSYMHLGEDEKFLSYMKRTVDIIDSNDQMNPFVMFIVGYAYWINGFQKEGKNHFDRGFDFYNQMITLGRHYIQEIHTYYNLAAAHAFLGNRDKAYEYLNRLNKKPRMPNWVARNMDQDPLMNNLRNDDEFQHLAAGIKAKFQAEHERVRVWLEQQELL